MKAECRWRARMAEGALRRGDWQDARQRVVDWEAEAEAGSNPCCGGGCTAQRGYLHGLSLKLKIMGQDAINDDLAAVSQGEPGFVSSARF